MVFLVSACLPAMETTPSPTSPSPSLESSSQPSPVWELSLKVSGGLRGLNLVISLTTGGELIVSDQRTGQQVFTMLTPEELDNINLLLTGVDLLEPALPLPTCGDCILYELDLQIDRSKFHALFNDLNLNETSAQPLINTLLQLQEAGLKK